MPETTFEIQVSFREGDRARLLQATAIDSSGHPLPALALTLEADANGTLHVEEERRLRKLETGSNGAVYFSWWPWPRLSPGRSFTSTLRATWEHATARVFIEDLFE